MSFRDNKMNKIGTTITLDQVEQRLCCHVAKVRFTENRRNGVENSLNKHLSWTQEATVQIDLDGYGGELAFCRLFNIYPDFTVHLRSTGEDKGDAKLPCGLAVDVKSTKYKNGNLITGIWKDDNTDLYALMVGEFPTYTFMGFMRKEDLRREGRVGDLGYGPTYIAPQEDLTELEEVKWKQK